MDREIAVALRERAMLALESSTKMLQVAQRLLEQGNSKEAARLQSEARYKRNESILLMDQASSVKDRSGNVLRFPGKHEHGEPGDREGSSMVRENHQRRTG
ncbi:MAG TPA: hypothetical protein VK208_00830 [Pyrinomonadaceae bacterium]|jgi:hypothetical protein|nr:hypothetical protein [Pyrinomonadaceae bacterium]